MELLRPDQLRQYADALTQPVFGVQDGVVSYTNAAFSALQISVGTPLESFFGTQSQSVQSGAELPCTVAGIACTATVFPMQGGSFYLLQLQDQTVSVHALSNTVRSIRAALHGMYSAAAGLFPQLEELEDEKCQRMSAGMLQEIYRMEHTVCNLELMQQLLCGAYTLNPEKTEIVNWLSGLFHHAEDLLQYAGIRLTAELPDKLFNGNLDCRLAQTVLWNAISNAAENTKDGTVFITAQHRDRLLQLTVSNRGLFTPQARSSLFKRYQVPVEETLTSTGAGFGLSVIRQAVQLHGGTMLFAVKPNDTVAFTVTFDLTKTAAPMLHTPIPVYAGLDEGLVHLAPVLPRSAYDSRDIL